MQLLFLQQWLPDEMLKAICWTLVHSLWQGLLAAVVAGIIIISTKRSSARLRYNLLGALLVIFLFTVVYTLNQLAGSANPAGPIANGIFDGHNNVLIDTAVNTSIMGVPYERPVDIFISFLNRYAGFFMSLWLVFFLFHCIKIINGIAGVHRFRTYKTHPASGWQAKLDDLSKTIGISRPVRLLQSELVKIPVAVGFFKPVILVPLGLLSNLPADQVETILLHELAHIRRRDYVMNILQRFAEAIFFFNPALLWISSLIRHEREACCDDIVVANTTHKGSYLQALVSFQEFSLRGSGYAMGISSKKHYLLNRVKRMLTRENKKLDIMEKILLIIGVTAISAFTFISKKETAAQQQPVRQAIKRTEEKPVALVPVKESAAATKPAPVRKTVTKKETIKPELNPAVLKDTVPSPAKEKAGDEDLDLQSISSSVNNDGKTKTSVITVVDDKGKKYMITKLNDKVTSLSIDGNNIPDAEISNYSTLLDKIDRAIEKKREERVKQAEIRKAEGVKRTEDARKRNEETKRKLTEQRRLGKLNTDERVRMKERLTKERKEKEIANDKRRRDMDERRRNIETERKARIKATRTNNGKTFLNGREVIKVENNADTKAFVYQQKQVVNKVQKNDLNKKILRQVNPDKKVSISLLTKKTVETNSTVSKVSFVEDKIKKVNLTNNIRLKQDVNMDFDFRLEETVNPPKPVKQPAPAKESKPVTKDKKTPLPPAPKKPAKQGVPAHTILT